MVYEVDCSIYVQKNLLSCQIAGGFDTGFVLYLSWNQRLRIRVFVTDTADKRTCTLAMESIDAESSKGNMWVLDQKLDQPMDEEAGRLRNMYREKVYALILQVNLIFDTLCWDSMTCFSCRLILYYIFLCAPLIVAYTCLTCQYFGYDIYLLILIHVLLFQLNLFINDSMEGLTKFFLLVDSLIFNVLFYLQFLVYGIFVL